jgi:dephospho-CoA kinase|tara:strand:- start:8623 stop:9228 length:606 start_codon:yes stop_codon:yes gene_type:complete
MVRIGVTGGIACGKSLVGNYLEEHGVAVRDADDIAHEVILNGHPAYDPVVELFGTEILDSTGEIDRRVLGEIVFSDPAKLARLSAEIHPLVRIEWTEWLQAQADQGQAGAAVIIPLLYEVGLSEGWDAVICVASQPVVQIERLIERGLIEEDARRRLGVQMSTDEKMRRADYVIVNNSTRASVREQVMRTMKNIMENNHAG